MHFVNTREWTRHQCNSPTAWSNLANEGENQNVAKHRQTIMQGNYNRSNLLKLVPVRMKCVNESEQPPDKCPPQRPFKGSDWFCFDGKEVGSQLVYKALTWLEKNVSSRGFNVFIIVGILKLYLNEIAYGFTGARTRKEKEIVLISTETDCEGHPSAGYSKRTPFLCKLLSLLVHF